MREGRVLAEDLAKHLQLSNWMVWVEVPLGPIPSSLADVIAVAKSFANPRFIIYEVKASRNDFLADTNRGKYRGYFEYCHQLYFAAPSGVVKACEIPEGCGLIVKGQNGWHSLKAAKRRNFEPPADMIIRLLIRGYQDHLERYRELEKERFKDDLSLREIAYRHGISIAHRLAEAEELIRKAEEVRAAISEAKGEELETVNKAILWLEYEVATLLKKRQYAHESLELATMVMSLFENQSLFIDSYPRRLREIANRIEAKKT